MPCCADWAQLLLGLAVPPLSLLHVLGTRRRLFLFRHQRQLRLCAARDLGVRARGAACCQAIVLLVAWLHGCIGLHFWLRLKPWYPESAACSIRRGAAAAGPGAARHSPTGGREVARLYARARLVRHAAGQHPFRHAGSACEPLCRRDALLLAIYAALLDRDAAGALVATSWCAATRDPASPIPTAAVVEIQPRHERSSRRAARAGIPHACVCGGRGRCSTCRVQVSPGLATLPPAEPGGTRVLKRVGRRPECAPCLPDAADARRLDRAAAAADRDAARRRSPARPSAGPRGGDRHPVRRSSRLHPASRKASCPTTWCSCSTAISAPWARRSR